MSLLLWPALSYHNIVGRIQAYVDPIIERIEQKLHIKRRRTKKCEVTFIFPVFVKCLFIIFGKSLCQRILNIEFMFSNEIL